MRNDFAIMIFTVSVYASSEENENVSSTPANHGGRCGLDCWLAKYADPEDVEQWYQDHKNMTEDVETWYARQPTFDFEGWYKNHSNINHFDWPDWLRQHVSKAACIDSNILKKRISST